MQFKGDNYAKHSSSGWYSENPSIGSFSSSGTFESFDTKIYNNFNIDYFAYLVYNMVVTAPAGTNGYNIFPFEDIFKYYKIENEVFTEIKTDDTDLVQNKIKSYYNAKIEVYDDGLKKSSDSLFKVAHNSPNYTVENFEDNLNVFTGKEIINLDIYAFDLVKIKDNFYALKLKDEILNMYIKKSKSICFSINIDVSILKNQGKKYAGFLDKSGLENFTIYEVNLLNNEEVD